MSRARISSVRPGRYFQIPFRRAIAFAEMSNKRDDAFPGGGEIGGELLRVHAIGRDPFVDLLDQVRDKAV